MEGVAVAARSLGLDTCPQATFAHCHAVIRTALGLAPRDMVMCGMSPGFADETAIPNRLRTGHEPVAGFAIFHPGATPDDNGANSNV